MDLDIKSLKGLTLDSRDVREGYLFAALPGTKTDGRKYIDQAIKSGAKAILAPSGTPLPDAANDGVLFITDDNPRLRFARIVSEFYGEQPDCIVAVTGTNGKTSVANFCQQLWAGLGHKAISVGTLGIRQSGLNIDFENSDAMTTPDPVALHREFKMVKELGVEHVAMEASSHGLSQYRLDGVRISAAGFTSFSRDHMDYHKNEQDYLDAKMRLFTQVVTKGGRAILNKDIKQFEALKNAAQSHDLKVWSYGENGDDFKIINVQSVPTGQDVTLQCLGKSFEFVLPLVGRFQLYNALCALGLVVAENPDWLERCIEILSGIKSVPGRIQKIDGHPKNAGVYIDYAHTPDAIETVLKSLRPHVHGKLVCVFGCGGDRDAGKRPLMGMAASKYADIAIVTDDNPRSEDPATIRAQASGGIEEIINIEGRKTAIKHALELLDEGDVLVITGKGHEQGQTFKDHTEPFCDAQVSRSIIHAMKKSQENS